MKLTERDEIVDEVRAARQAYAAQFDYDIRRIMEDLQAKEAEHPKLRADLSSPVRTTTKSSKY